MLTVKVKQANVLFARQTCGYIYSEGTQKEALLLQLKRDPKLSGFNLNEVYATFSSGTEKNGSDIQKVVKQTILLQSNVIPT